METLRRLKGELRCAVIEGEQQTAHDAQRKLDLIFIENVGNLVCPSSFDLGENEKTVLMSITEGEDKPVKYPLAFSLARLMVLTKTDLLPHLRFDMDLCKSYAYRTNSQIEILETSVFNENGLDSWLGALRKRVNR